MQSTSDIVSLIFSPWFYAVVKKRTRIDEKAEFEIKSPMPPYKQNLPVNKDHILDNSIKVRQLQKYTPSLWWEIKISK